MKQLFIALVLMGGLFAISANMDDQNNIAYVDLDRVMNLMPEMEKVAELNEKLDAKLAQTIAKDTRDLRDEIEKLNKIIDEDRGSGNDTESAIEKASGLKKKIATISEQHTTVIEKEKRYLIDPIRETVQDAIVQVAKRSGYRFVLDSKKEAGLSLIVLAPEENDLTLAVIEELGLKDRK